MKLFRTGAVLAKNLPTLLSTADECGNKLAKAYIMAEIQKKGGAGKAMKL